MLSSHHLLINLRYRAPLGPALAMLTGYAVATSPRMYRIRKCVALSLTEVILAGARDQYDDAIRPSFEDFDPLSTISPSLMGRGLLVGS